MALIGKIRNNSWILIVLIGLGLGGFIIMDMFSGQQSVFGSSQTIMGDINGNKVDWQEFNRTYSLLYSNSPTDVFGAREYLWNYYIEDALVQEEADGLGLGVSNDELMELQFGPNFSPIMQQRFTNPSTGQIDLERIRSFENAVKDGSLNSDPNVGPFWAHQEKEIIKERLQSKLNAMVSKAIYTPTWMVEKTHSDQNTRLDFAYVQIPFDEVDNSEVNLTDEDYQNYLEANKSQYMEDEETRRLSYVTFNVEPTQGDSAKLRQGVVDLIEEFRTTDDDSTFVDNNYGSIDDVFVEKSALAQVIADTVFSAPVGSVIGPYIDEGGYKLVKLLDRQVLPDSVRSRHILINAKTQQEYIAAVQTIDSLKGLIEAGTHQFDSLAIKFSQGPSAPKGGDLGYAAPGTMVKPFNDLIFFQAEVGDVEPVITQFGVHLVEVLDKKYIKNDEGVKVAYVTQAIVPSEATQKAIYNEVLEFVSQNRDLTALATSAEANEKLELETSPALKMNDFTVGNLGGGNTSRDLVRWAYSGDAEPGTVSASIYTYQDPVEFFESKYVVAGLKGIQKANRVELTSLKDEIKAAVMNEKKGELLISRINGTDLGAIASTFSSQVDTARSVTFVANFVQGLGNEPKVISSAYEVDMNQVSAPIIGNNGVYLIKPVGRTEAPAPTSIPQMRKLFSSSVQGQVAGQLIQAIKKNADIDDYRSKFY
ncbi:MAG: peptidylprolyl isomerase [Bacteroidota bacterium]